MSNQVVRELKILWCIINIALLCACSSARSLPAGEGLRQEESTGENAQSTDENVGAGELHCIPKKNLYFGGSTSQQGYYTITSAFRADGSTNLLYSDYATQQTVYLCSAANCTHDADSCTSWIPFSGGGSLPLVVGETLVLAYPGNLIYAEQIGQMALPHFERMALDGSHRQALGALEANQEILRPFITDGACLYFTVRTYSEQAVQQAFAKLDIATGKIEFLFDLDQTKNEIVFGAAGSYVITLQNGEVQTTLVHGTGQREDVISDQLCRYDLNSLQKEKIFEFPLEDTRFSQYDERFIYIKDENRELHIFDVISLQDEMIQENIFPEVEDLLDLEVAEAEDDHILVFSNIRDKNMVVTNNECIAIDLKTKGAKRWDLLYQSGDRKSPITIVAKVPDTTKYFVLADEQEPANLSGVAEEGAPLYLPSMERTFALMEKEDYWNSVKELMCFSKP